MSHLFSPEERAAAVARIETGESLRDVAASIGSTPATVEKWAIAAQWWKQPVDTSDPDAFVGIADAARILGVDTETLSRLSDRSRTDHLPWRWVDVGEPAWRVRDLLEFRNRRQTRQEDQPAA